MSGGVDSSVAAYLLKEAGWAVGGATIRTWASGECKDINTKTCCGIIGVEDARNVAWKLNIPYHVFNFEAEFKAKVVDYFSSEYLKGRTPNPCIACNQHIKFELFLKRARELGYSHIATGHYAQIIFDKKSGRYGVKQGADLSKDQSYVLFPLSQDVLSHLELPVGHYPKSEIRAIARRLELKVADKPDSMEICFIPSNDYAGFLERELKLGENPGDIVDQEGKVIGRHKGHYHYTIGQRKGINIAHQHALYVTDIIPQENLVVVGSKSDVKRPACGVANINWFYPVNGAPVRVRAKIRAHHEKAWGILRKISETDAEITFETPQDAITPGQACVFYDNDTVLGGGWIK